MEPEVPDSSSTLNEPLPNSANGFDKSGHSGEVLAALELSPLGVISCSLNDDKIILSTKHNHSLHVLLVFFQSTDNHAVNDITMTTKDTYDSFVTTVVQQSTQYCIWN